MHFKSEIVKDKPNLKKKEKQKPHLVSAGKVNLNSMPDPPDYLRSLFDESNPNSREFYHNIRSYNNSLVFASFNANLIDFNGRRPSPFWKMENTRTSLLSNQHVFVPS